MRFPLLRIWLPRSRGDRPGAHAPMPAHLWAAPLTRGSTCEHAGRAADHPGCPAHAGIDPCAMLTGVSRLGLPRSRGDRPPPPHGERIGVLAAPLTRGSTRRAAGEHDGPSGCPAHAGIDPRPFSSRAAAPRLPRSRGDRPVDNVVYETGTLAAPLTRGSTRIRQQPARRFGGCPAHAGIDPMRHFPAKSLPGLPRSRGDRPQFASVCRCRVAAAPLTRGSTFG